MTETSGTIAMGLPIQRAAPVPAKSNLVRFTPRTPATNATLQGWKEIAAELNRSVRTVQRWEQNLGLPVHKLGNGLGSPVFAFKEELRSWLRVKADKGMKTETGASSTSVAIDQDELLDGLRPAVPMKGRGTFKSRTTASEPDIVKLLNAFFALKRADHNSASCNHCHASTRLLVGHFWLYGTDKTWQVSVPFCPQCDSDLRAMLPQSPDRLT
jgi:hypothetical protein